VLKKFHRRTQYTKTRYWFLHIVSGTKEMLLVADRDAWQIKKTAEDSLLVCSRTLLGIFLVRYIDV